ncbi:MAG: hypothetical protein QI223_08300 [Candidatus Korarchaeota archaeon]|nr:hypothetical protein [Candidatus Korarchaeota archaeon]
MILGHLIGPREAKKSKPYTALLLDLMVLIDWPALRCCVLSAGFLRVPRL